MSYEYLAKVGRDLLPLVEACRGLEVKVLQKFNRQDYDAALKREWDDAVKKAETKLRQFVTLKDRLDKQNGDDAAAMLSGAKVPKLNLGELEAELTGLKERVGRQLTSLERLSSLENAIDKEQERVRVDELKEKEKEKEKEKQQQLEQAEKERQRQEEEAQRKRKEEEEEEAAAARAEAEGKKIAEQREREKKEEEERQAAIKKKAEEEEAQKQQESKKTSGGHSDNLLNLIDSINDEVLSEILADDKQGPAKAGRGGRPQQQNKERRPRGERQSPRGEVSALSESSVVSPRRQPQPQPAEQHVEPQLPVIDDEMEELRMRLKRLEEGEEMTSDKESELERVEKSLQDDFERGLARSGGSSTSSEKGASPTLGTAHSGGAEEEATEEDTSYILHDNDHDHGNNGHGDDDDTPRRKIPLDPITPRTKREFETQDRDEEEDADELPEEKAGEREIKYLTLKKKPIPKNKKKAQEEEEQKITFHEGEPPGYHRGGYLKRLERKAIVKHKWQTRWMRLDSQYLSVYGSAAEASKDKSGKLALQQYRLYDLEEVALARNIHGMEIAFKLRFNDRQVLLSASTKNLMAKWMLAIDSVAHRRNYNETETAFITKLSQRDVCLRRLYLPVTEDGIISCVVDDVEYKWRYRRDESSQVGELVSDDGTRAYTWDAEYLRPKSDSELDCGYGVWDGIWLTWYSADKRFVMRYQWHSAIEEFHFVSASPAIKTTFIEFPPFRYNGKVLLSSDRAFSWRVKGNKVPPPVVLSLQILYYQQNAKHK